MVTQPAQAPHRPDHLNPSPDPSRGDVGEHAIPVRGEDETQTTLGDPPELSFALPQLARRPPSTSSCRSA